MRKNPLGVTTAIPDDYAPDVLFGVSRQTARESFLSGSSLPFHGEDIWNAWELTWLDKSGRPRVGTATIRVRAESESVVESKSLKLYLNSLANSRHASESVLSGIIAADLGAVTASPVTVDIVSDTGAPAYTIGAMPGLCIDDLDGDFSATAVDPGLLRCDGDTVTEILHSHLLRSLCPVTGQPDIASVSIHYEGPKIALASLLEYLVSYRQHQDFHETCVERIFIDLKSRCEANRLSVHARYCRRGGIDINPFRSDFEESAANRRLWRQ